MRTVIEFDDECVESVNCDNDEEFVRDHENLSTEFIENIEYHTRYKRGKPITQYVAVLKKNNKKYVFILS